MLREIGEQGRVADLVRSGRPALAVQHDGRDQDRSEDRRDEPREDGPDPETSAGIGVLEQLHAATVPATRRSGFGGAWEHKLRCNIRATQPPALSLMRAALHL